jgi:hypothetical protein
MTAREFTLWKAFNRLHPIDLAFRIEVAIAYAFACRYGGAADDYRVDWPKPWREEAEADQPDLSTSIDAVFNAMAMKFKASGG